MHRSIVRDAWQTGIPHSLSVCCENNIVFAPSLFPEGPREEYREAICIDSLHPATRCIRMHLVGGALNPQDLRDSLVAAAPGPLRAEPLESTTPRKR